MKKREELSKNQTRRKFIKTTALGVGMLTTSGSLSFAEEKHSLSNDKNSLQIAGYDVNRVKALIDGKVQIKGVNTNFTKGNIGGLNTNTFVGPQTYDITEIGLVPYILAYANDDFRDYSLLPIFPLRVFRHKSAFIRTDGKIKTPEDLKGKAIGTPGYSSTSLTWLRGIFKDEYGVAPEDVEWVISKKDSSSKESGKVSKNEQLIPKGITVREGKPGMDESDLLLSGEVDALFHAAQPRAYMEGNPLIGTLFPNSRKTEQEYYKKTGIFPIMHAIAVRNSLIKKHPQLVKDIFNAYSESKKMDFKFMKSLGWAYNSLPWYGQELESTIEVMGDNYWPYGIKPNRKALETLFRYSYEQGLSSRQLTIEDVFETSSLELIE
jgi:4,5-dihydroxyphthalate decarboxylase